MAADRATWLGVGRRECWRLNAHHSRSLPMTTVSIITGGSRGLGSNTALSIARHGGDVILTYRSEVAAAEAIVLEIKALGRKAVALQLDVSDVATFPAFVASVRSTLESHWGRDTF